jgi:hypothetical protein
MNERLIEMSVKSCGIYGAVSGAAVAAAAEGAGSIFNNN